MNQSLPCEEDLAADRLDALDRVTRLIAQDLDLDRIVQRVTDVATELSGAKFGAFFYNLKTPEGESYMLYTLSGAPRSAFEAFGMPRNTALFEPTFRGSAVVRSDDIRKDPRYGRNAPHRGMPQGHLPVVSYLAVPVIGREGEILGGLFFGHDEAGRFTRQSEDIVISIAAHAAIAINNARLLKAAQDEIAMRKQAEAAKDLLVHEVQHRVKNTLGIVQAIVAQTFRTAAPADHKAFNARLQALAGAHDLLIHRQWQAAEVGDLVRLALDAFQDRGEARLVAEGPSATLGATKAMLLAMILHELGTNAVKYGALSCSEGRVDVRWSLGGTGRKQLDLTWREHGGPKVTEPGRRGFGSTLITRALSGESGGASLEYHPEGLICRVTILL